ncbi:MAG TPA: hypothetical protein VFI25_05330 [Planctomycetota bacterium]|nr:hypothetical protein [Planctomycetota bacterium]
MNWSPAAACDENASDPMGALGAKSGRPLMVLVYDSEADLKILDGACGTDERVAIGAKAFQLLKVSASKLPETGDLASSLGGKATPRFVFFDEKGKKVVTVDEKVSPGKVYDAMKRTAGAPLEGFVKDYQKFLTAVDKLESDKATLKVKLERLGSRADKDTAVASKQKEIDSAAEKLVAAEKKLLEKIS